MKIKQKIKKKGLISEVIALRLPASQLLYQHNFNMEAFFTICSLPQIAPC